MSSNHPTEETNPFLPDEEYSTSSPEGESYTYTKEELEEFLRRHPYKVPLYPESLYKYQIPAEQRHLHHPWATKEEREEASRLGAELRSRMDADLLESNTTEPIREPQAPATATDPNPANLSQATTEIKTPEQASNSLPLVYVDQDGKRQWLVKAIVDSRRTHGIYQYKVKWQDEDANNDSTTWERLANVLHLTKLREEYHVLRTRKKRPTEKDIEFAQASVAGVSAKPGSKLHETTAEEDDDKHQATEPMKTKIGNKTVGAQVVSDSAPSLESILAQKTMANDGWRSFDGNGTGDFSEHLIPISKPAWASDYPDQKIPKKRKRTEDTDEADEPIEAGSINKKPRRKYLTDITWYYNNGGQRQEGDSYWSIGLGFGVSYREICNCGERFRELIDEIQGEISRAGLPKTTEEFATRIEAAKAAVIREFPFLTSEVHLQYHFPIPPKWKECHLQVLWQPATAMLSWEVGKE